jgi:hypothetical protein
MYTVVRSEKDNAPDLGEGLREIHLVQVTTAWDRSSASRSDVLDESRAAFGAVAYPRFVAVRAIFGAEIDALGTGGEPRVGT